MAADRPGGTGIARSLAKLMEVVDFPSPGKLDTTPMTLQR
jgi:hypothetical protein